MKRTPAPMFNWELPDVELPPNDGTFHELTAEQWVVWFRTLPTAAQIAAAQTILELQRDKVFQPTPVQPAVHSEHTVQELRARIVDIQNALRSILVDTKDMRPQKKRAALLAERIIAIGLAIKEMRL